MPDFPDNQKYVQPGGAAKKEKDVQPVVTTAVIHKKPLGSRLKELFVGGEAKTAWGHVLLDVLVPAAKETIVDAVVQGVERMVYGEGVRPRGGSRGSNIAHTAYNRMYGNAVTAMPRETAGPRTGISPAARSRHDFGEAVLPSRAEAQEVLSGMYTLLSEYEQVSVADLYSLLGMEGSGHTDNKFGWFSLDGSDVIRRRDGYVLQLPRAQAL